jgi:hypothetical protein
LGKQGGSAKQEIAEKQNDPSGGALADKIKPNKLKPPHHQLPASSVQRDPKTLAKLNCAKLYD